MIETDRLILRLPEPRDRAALCAMFANPDVMADLGPVKDSQATDAALAKHDSYRHEGLGFWTVERRTDGAMLGFCGLKRGDPHHPIAGEIEAGWIIDQPYWRQGYALEAMAAGIRWGWDNFAVNRIVAITSEVNIKSQQMMLRLGMVKMPDGRFDHCLLPEGDRLRSLVTYAVYRPTA